MIFKLLRSAPHKEKIQDQATVDKTYKYWRIRTMYGMYVGYVMFYFTRKSFTFVMPKMITVMHFSKAELGLVGTLFYLIYGFSKFLSGMLSDRSSPRYFMAFGLIATGIVNIFFGFSSSLLILVLFWSINAFFQGWGWPPCARLLTHWYSRKERGRWWAIWNTSHNVGGALVPLLIAACLMLFASWRIAMVIPGILAAFIGFYVINRLRGVPATLGLPAIEEYKNDYQPKAAKDSAKKLPMLEILMKYVIKNKYIWMLAISYVLVYVVRTALNDWGAVYLNEKGASVANADICMSFFEIGGFLGSLAAGWCSDLIFKGKRGPVNVLYSVGIVFAVAGFWLIPGANLVLHGILIFAIGFLVFGPQMLIGMAAAELTHKEAAGTSTGFIGLFGYIGAALSGFPLGWIEQTSGWNGFFLTVGLCAILSIFCLLPLWPATERPDIRGIDYDVPEEEATAEEGAVA